MESEKKNPGRPKKNKTIPVADFEGTVSAPVTRGAINEIKISEATVLNQYLKTFKTLKVDELTIYFMKDKLIIESLIDNRANGGKAVGDKRLYIVIKKVFSYYCERPCAVHIKSIVNLESLMDEIDENTKYLILYTTEVNNVLSYKIFDEVNDINTSSSIDVKSISYDFPAVILPSELDVKLSINGYKSGDLKKTFNKKTRRKCTKCTLKAKDDVIDIEFVPSNGKVTKVTMNSRKTKPIVSTNRGELYVINIPKSDINQFIMHIRDNITAKFSDKYILMENESDTGMQIRYQIPIVNEI